MIYFTSDHHFWHSNVIKYCYRPYKSVEEMNECLIDNWNNTVKPDDIIYNLGDFSMAKRPVEEITPKLNGIKYLVPGNHDLCHNYHKKSRKQGTEKWIKFYEDCGWNVLPQQTEIIINGVRVNMCHHPYKGDWIPTEENPDKYWDYRLEDKGDWLICGHVHEKWQIKNKMINVGVDVWDYKPVNIEVIKEIIGAK